MSDQRIQPQGVVDHAEIGDGARQAHAGGCHEHAPLTQREMAAVDRILPRAAHGGATRYGAADLLQVARRDRQRGEREAVQCDIGDERASHTPRAAHPTQREIVRNRGGGGQYAAPGAVARRGIEHQPLRRVAQADVGVRCPMSAIHCVTERGTTHDRGGGARALDARRRRQHAVARCVPLQRLQHGRHPHILRGDIEPHRAILRYDTVGEQAAAGGAAEIHRIQRHVTVRQPHRHRMREPPRKRVEPRTQRIESDVVRSPRATRVAAERGVRDQRILLHPYVGGEPAILPAARRHHLLETVPRRLHPLGVGAKYDGSRRGPHVGRARVRGEPSHGVAARHEIAAFDTRVDARRHDTAAQRSSGRQRSGE